MRFKQYLLLSEGITKKRKMTLYHGVRKADNIKKILAKGFSLSMIDPRWVNDYAVSAAKSKKAVTKFFGREVGVLKFTINGNVWKADHFDNLGNEVGTFASKPQQFTRDVIQAGIDAADLGQTVYIYNPKIISNIEVA